MWKPVENRVKRRVRTRGLQRIPAKNPSEWVRGMKFLGAVDLALLCSETWGRLKSSVSSSRPAHAWHTLGLAARLKSRAGLVSPQQMQTLFFVKLMSLSTSMYTLKHTLLALFPPKCKRLPIDSKPVLAHPCKNTTI